MKTLNNQNQRKKPMKFQIKQNTRFQNIKINYNNMNNYMKKKDRKCRRN